MIKEAEEFAEEDKIAKERIDAKNQLEGFIFSLKNTIEDTEKLANKLSSDEKSTIENAIKEAQSWLSSNPEATKEEFEEQQKKLESVSNPIVSKHYKESGAPTEDSKDTYDDASDL